MSEPEPSPAASVGPHRRAVLRAMTAGGALLATTGAVAGCSGGSEQATTPDPPQTGGKLVAAADVPVGGGVKAEGRPIIVVQPQSGTIKAFSATCTHAGCEMKQVADGLINCPCHGSAFSVEDGSVKNGPARAPLREIPVSVDGDTVVTA